MSLTKSPKVAFAVAGRTAFTRHFDETLVEAQIVPDAVLPSFLVLLVVRKFLHYVTLVGKYKKMPVNAQ